MHALGRLSAARGEDGHVRCDVGRDEVLLSHAVEQLERREWRALTAVSVEGGVEDEDDLTGGAAVVSTAWLARHRGDRRLKDVERHLYMGGAGCMHLVDGDACA